MYAYAAGDPVGHSDPLGLWPDLSLLTGHLPPQAVQHFQQLRHSVRRAVLPHLGTPLKRHAPAQAPTPDPRHRGW